MVFEGESSKSNAMTQLYISKGKLYFGGEVMNLSDFADASKLNLIQEFLATYKTRNINLKKLADPKETAYKTHVIDNGLLTTNAGFETEYDANNKPISKKGEASNPKTLFKSLDLQVYSTKEEKMSNRFRQATVYVNPSLNNPSELVKPTEEVKTETPATQSDIKAKKAQIEKLKKDKQENLKYKKSFFKGIGIFDNYEEVDDTGLSEPVKKGFFIKTIYEPFGNKKDEIVFSTIEDAENFINAKYDAQIAQKQAELKALESKPLESSEKSSILSPLNTTETIIEQQEKLKENMTDISSPVTREPNKINLEANQEAIAKQKESLTKNTMSAAEKLAARKNELDCNQRNKK
jgi:hypothetical protein